MDKGVDLSTYSFDRQVVGQNPTRPLNEWTVPEVTRFIEIACRSKFGSEKTEYYKQLVIDNDVDGEILSEMTDAQLQKLGIKSFGHRHYILKRIQAVATGGEKVELSPSTNSATLYYNSRGAALTPDGGSQRTEGGSHRALDAGVGGMRGNEVPAHTNFTKPAQPRLHHPTPRIHESQVTIGRKIGSGSVGYVFEGKYEQHPVAIKKHKTDGTMMDHKALAEFEVEVGKMTAVNHPCIVRCYGMLDPSPGIVMELVQGGALFQILHGERGETYEQYKQRLPWNQRLRFLLDAMYGLRAVHNANLIHGDFKTLNLLVERDQRVKVADFGLSKVLDALSVLPGTKTITGTPQYMAPEVMLSQPQGMRVDIYSAAIVMWEILTGCIPWKGMDIVQIIHQVTQEANKTMKPPPGRPRLEQQHVISALPGYVQLMHECWAQIPSERPSTDQCVQQLEAIQLAQRGIRAGGQPAFQQPTQPGSRLPASSAQPFHMDRQAVSDKRQRIGDPGLLMPQWQQGENMQGGGPRELMPPPAWTPRGAPMLTSSAPQISIQRPMMPPPMFFAAGGMGVLANMMENSGSDNQRQAAQVVFEACSDNPHNQQLLHESGAMQKMVQLLQTGSTQEVKSRAAEAIAAACAQNRDNRREALQANALEPLVNMLEASNVQTQESAANALANVINSRETAGMLPETGIGGHVLTETGQNALHRLGGVRKLVHLVETGVPRVKEAAAAAIANAMLDNESNRIAFQEAGGVGPLVNLLKSGDINAQEHATTALWNAMVDNEATRIDLINHPQGLPLLIQVLWSGTEVTKESAAGAIWKACVADTSIKDRLFVAIPALVQLLENGSANGQTQAAGALRGVLINSTLNKQELNRCGGISALVECIRKGVLKARVQAGAALANACANSVDNQNAARHAGAMQVLVDQLKNATEMTAHGETSEMLEIAAAGIRNLCGNSVDNSEVGALWKSCMMSKENCDVVCTTGIQHIEHELKRQDCTEEMKRCVVGLLNVLKSTSIGQGDEETVCGTWAGGSGGSGGAGNSSSVTSMDTQGQGSVDGLPPVMAAAAEKIACDPKEDDAGVGGGNA